MSPPKVIHPYKMQVVSNVSVGDLIITLNMIILYLPIIKRINYFHVSTPDLLNSDRVEEKIHIENLQCVHVLLIDNIVHIMIKLPICCYYGIINMLSSEGKTASVWRIFAKYTCFQCKTVKDLHGPKLACFLKCYHNFPCPCVFLNTSIAISHPNQSRKRYWTW